MPCLLKFTAKIGLQSTIGKSTQTASKDHLKARNVNASQGRQPIGQTDSTLYADILTLVIRKFGKCKCNFLVINQGFPNMPFVKCLSGFAEVPYQVPPWPLPDASRMPKNKSKEAYLVPVPKACRYCKVLVVKCFAGCAEGPCQGQPHLPSKIV